MGRGALSGRGPVGAGGTLVIQAGDVTLRITPAPAALAERIRTSVRDVTFRAVDEGVRGVFGRAVAAWPVDTGLSRSLLTLEDTGDADEPRWRIRGRAGYTGYVRGRGASRPAVVDLVRAPLAEALADAARRAADDLRTGKG